MAYGVYNYFVSAIYFFGRRNRNWKPVACKAGDGPLMRVSDYNWVLRWSGENDNCLGVHRISILGCRQGRKQTKMGNGSPEYGGQRERLLNFAGDTNVGKKHKFLDEGVGFH